MKLKGWAKNTEKIILIIAALATIVSTIVLVLPLFNQSSPPLEPKEKTIPISDKCAFTPQTDLTTQTDFEKYKASFQGLQVKINSSKIGIMKDRTTVLVELRLSNGKMGDARIDWSTSRILDKMNERLAYVNCDSNNQGLGIDERTTEKLLFSRESSSPPNYPLRLMLDVVVGDSPGMIQISFPS